MTPADLELQDLALITEDDLPHSDDEVMETARHKMQIDILMETLRPWLAVHPDGGYTGGDMFVYYSPQQVKNQDFKGPDFFAALGVSNRERKSWVCWQEGKPPDVVIELLSESTTSFDKKQKKQVYQDRLKVPEYIWYDPWNPADWAGFRLQDGTFVDTPINTQGQMYIRALDLLLVRWQGRYAGVDTVWLRWAYPDGTLLPTQEELAIQAQAEADQAQAEAVQARAEAIQAQAEAIQAQAEVVQAQTQVQQMVQNLRRMGMEVEQIAQISGLSIEEIQNLNL
jgi:Uma2 family endonuclease